MPPPDTIWIYRITHIENLDYDLGCGLHTAGSSEANPNYKRIGDSSLIDYRKSIEATNPPGGILSEYIPFYLGPRSPMLYQIAKGWEDIEQFNQQDIIYYISSLSLIKQQQGIFFYRWPREKPDKSILQSRC